MVNKNDQEDCPLTTLDYMKVDGDTYEIISAGVDLLYENAEGVC